MESDSKKISPEESLMLIGTMIRQAQGKVQKNAFYFLLWGWVITAANLGVYLLSQLDYPRPYLVWLITIPAWIYTFVRAARRSSATGSTSHFDRISSWLWIMFGLVIFTLVFFGSKINYQLNPVILLIGSLPTLVSGVILRFRPLIAGGFVFWAFGIIGFLVVRDIQPLVGAAAIIGGYLIPGYLLKNSKD